MQGLREKLTNIQSTVRQLPVLLQPWVNRVTIAMMQPYADGIAIDLDLLENRLGRL